MQFLPSCVGISNALKNLSSPNVDISASIHIYHIRRLAIVVLGSPHYPTALGNIARVHPSVCQCRIALARKKSLGRASSQQFQQRSLQLRTARHHPA
eukprot:10384790-Karenia_brevis.AAC.1